MSQNHVIDPTFFYDALALFAFSYDAYIVTGRTTDEYGHQRSTFEKVEVVGSLQSQGLNLTQSKSGNTQSWQYNFYCKSSYRLNKGDFIVYQGKLLMVTNVQDFDEWGVRSMECQLTTLAAQRDLAEFIKFQTGEATI